MLSILIGCVLLTQTIVIGYPGENDEFRNFGLSKTYFSNFDVEQLNPFNWISGNRNTVTDDDDDDVKFEKFFKIIECLAKDGKDCARLVDEAKPYFVKTTENRMSTTPSKEESPKSTITTTTTNPTIMTRESFNQK